MNTNQRQTTASVVGGLILIALGALFLIGNLIRVDIWGALWPVLIMAFGVAFFIGMVAGGKTAGGLAIPGSMFVVLGVIFLAQQLLGHWESWSYAWSLFVFGGIGIGLLINSWWSNKPELKRSGYIMITLGIIFFMVFGTFFEALYGLFGIGFVGNALWPLMLIFAGVLLLFTRLINLNTLIDRLPPHASHDHQEFPKLEAS